MAVIQNITGPQTCIVDCLSLFVANLLYGVGNTTLSAQVVAQMVLERGRDLLVAMEKRKDLFFLVVTNEVGLGIVPDNATTRLYRDMLGEINQEFANKACAVWLCCVGQAIELKAKSI